MSERNREWWDRWHIGMVQYIATASKDPSTKVGALIIRSNRTPVSWGYNGFPRGVEDTPERLANRELKYKMVVHAEENSILNAHGLSLEGCVMYSLFIPCSGCAKAIIQTGIKEVVCPAPTTDYLTRWGEDIAISKQMFEEAGVLFRIVPFT
jgi:dCMP deaminase